MLVILFWPLIIIGGIALIFALGFFILLRESVFSEDTRRDFFKYEGWKETGLMSLGGAIVFAICITILLHL